MQKKVANVIIEYLRQEKIKYIFGITGKAISPLFGAVEDYNDITSITTRHEGGAAFMAYGYAQASKTIGVCCGTTGGGSTNLLTGVATAYMNSVPMIVITGQVPTKDYGKGGFQESTGEGRSLNVVELFKATTKHSTQLINPNKVEDVLRNAIRIALSDRMGPIHINVPLDINFKEVDYELKSREFFVPTSKSACNNESVERAVELIERANKPLFLTGWGTIINDGHHEVIKIAEKLNIPIATTLQGKGAIRTNHPLCLGIVGLCGHEPAINYAFEEADLLIAIGTTFGEFASLNWHQGLATNKKLIQIDIDATEIGKNYSVDLGLVGDAKTVLQQIHTQIERRSVFPKSFKHNLSETGWEINKYSEPGKMESLSIPLKPQRVLKERRDSTPKQTIFLADSGSHWGWAMHYLPIYEGGAIYPTIGLGSMGAGVCSAIGIKLAKPSSPVVSNCGDGSFQMNGNEIATAKQFKVPVIWIIFNDSRYGMVYHATKKIYGRACGAMLYDVNFAKIAEGFGVRGYRIEKPNELADKLPKAIRLNEPVVMDVLIDPEECPPVGQRLRY